MEDLFREEDFIEEKKFRPWRYVLVYYLVALLHIAVFTASVRKTIILPRDQYLFYAFRIWVIMSIGFPVFLAFAMVFFDKKMTFLRLKTIFLSLLGLGVTYLVGFLFVSIIDREMDRREYNSDDILIPLGLSVFLVLLFCLLVLPVARYKQKRKVLTNQDYA